MIAALAESWVTNTPLVKMFCPQKETASSHIFEKHNKLKFWSITDMSRFLSPVTL
jgi:hypothetical protein